MTQDATFYNESGISWKMIDRKVIFLCSVELYFIDFVMAKACFIYRN